jgi:MoxR-like ATPase
MFPKPKADQTSTRQRDKPAIIHATVKSGYVILSGDTYNSRAHIRENGFAFHNADSSWRAPATPDNLAYARSIATHVVDVPATPPDAYPVYTMTAGAKATDDMPSITDILPADVIARAIDQTTDPTDQTPAVDAPRRRIKRTAEPDQTPPQADPAAASDLMDALRGFVLANAAASKAGEIDPEKVQAIITRELEAVYGKLDVVTSTVAMLMEKLKDRPTVRVDVVTQDATRTIDGLSHHMLPTLIRSLATGLHVWLAGPSGSGKTHGAEQAAQALGLTFRLQGAMTMAHELAGFVDAGGKYHETPFVTTFRNGGLILLDELDAGSNEALLALNAALANGIMCLPSGEIIRAHADFRCCGAANTFGQGATADYVGRTRIDAAFLQRFGVRLTWAYDEALETAMANMPAWSERVQRARQRAKEAGLKVLITPRASIAGAKLIRAGFSPDEAANMTYLADLSPAQRGAVE